jgi:peptide/nickel transport system permease protein
VSRYIARRALLGLIALIGVSLLVFVAVRLTGDPAQLYLPLNASNEARKEFSHLRGFDQPIIVQLGSYLAGVLHGDLGQSLRLGRPALAVVLEHYPNTLLLAGLGMAGALLLAVLLGGLSGARPMSRLDRAVTVVSLACSSIPDFWMGLMLIFGLAIQGRLFPTSGADGPQYWVLPVITIMARPFGLLTQVVRGAMTDAMAAPYVATARSRGVGEPRVIFVHALRNAWLPIITVAGDLTVSLVNGAIIVETLFGIPGVGQLLIDSVNQRDFAVVQATVIVTGATIILLNLLIDVLYARVNPRIRLAVRFA